MKKINLQEWGKLIFGMFIVAVGVYYFMIPGNVVLGSISGLVMVLVNFIPLSQSALTFILNAVLLMIGYIFIGKEFGIKTVITSMMLPFFLAVFEIITPNNHMLVTDKFANTIIYLVIITFGQSILFNANASTGGLDIVAKMISKYMRVELGKGIQIAGFATAASSILVYDTETFVYSIFGTYLSGIILDYFIDGAHVKKKVCILSPEVDKIRGFISNELKRGVTLYKVYGGIKNDEKTEIVTVLEKNEYQKLLEFIHTTDSTAFVTVTNIGEVFGRWNTKKGVTHKR